MKAIYAGSFDPPTKGHEWMITRGAAMFDSLVVAIGVNPAKKAMFSPDERYRMLDALTSPYSNVDVQNFGQDFLIHFAKKIGASYLLRGIRTAADYEYERAMRHINDDIAPEITTVFLIPPRAIAEVSSSLVKSLIGPSGWEALVAKYVDPCVLERLKETR